MNNKTKYTIAIIVILLIVFIPSVIFAQPGGGLDDDPGTPIDGGASLLAGAAAMYGIKKLRKKKADKAEKEL